LRLHSWPQSHFALTQGVAVGAVEAGWSRWRWQVERAAPPNGRYCIGRMTIAIGGQFDDNP
jgi:hypothetical protein